MVRKMGAGRWSLHGMWEIPNGNTMGFFLRGCSIGGRDDLIRFLLRNPHMMNVVIIVPCSDLLTGDHRKLVLRKHHTKLFNGQYGF